jgi:hypothetical protein
VPSNFTPVFFKLKLRLNQNNKKQNFHYTLSTKPNNMRSTPILKVNAIHLLKGEHSKVKQLLSDIKSTNDNNIKRVNLNQVVKDLSQHAAIEEQVILEQTR